jgi:hypothetical protein
MAEIEMPGLTSSRWWAKPGNKGKAGWFMGGVFSERPLLPSQALSPVTCETRFGPSVGRTSA